MSARGGELIHDGQGVDLDQVDQLVGDHGRLVFAMVAQVDGGRGAKATLNDDPIAAMNEVLRLAHLGAFAEAAWREDPTRRVHVVINQAAARWKNHHGLI